MEVCEELAFHGIEYILSVSVADGQVLHVDVEKVKAPCTSRNARCSALHDAIDITKISLVRVDNEILVMYQPDRGFFGGVQGRCRCLCEKRIPECCV